MPIEFRCDRCQKLLRVPDNSAGKQSRCPHCKSVQAIPESTASASLHARPNPPPSSSNSPNSSEPSFSPPSSNSGQSYSATSHPSSSYSSSYSPSSGSYNPYSSPPQSGSSSRFAIPHRGGLVLGMGIAAIIITLTMPFMGIQLIFGIIAWVLGHIDLKKMDAGEMDPSGRDGTLTGKILGIISVVITIFGAFGCCGCVLLSD